MPSASTAPVTRVAPAASLDDDFPGALASLGTDQAFFITVLETYLGELSQAANELDQHLARNDRVAATRVLHTMKGLSTSVGAHRMSQIAKTAEHTLKAADKDFQDHTLRANFRAAIVTTKEVVHGVIEALKGNAAGA
jgi:two-component system, sensor histidine kinase and response regulator